MRQHGSGILELGTVLTHSSKQLRKAKRNIVRMCCRHYFFSSLLKCCKYRGIFSPSIYLSRLFPWFRFCLFSFKCNRWNIYFHSVNNISDTSNAGLSGPKKIGDSSHSLYCYNYDLQTIAQSLIVKCRGEFSQLAGGIKANLSLLITAPRQFDLILIRAFILRGSITISHTSL